MTKLLPAHLLSKFSFPAKVSNFIVSHFPSLLTRSHASTTCLILDMNMHKLYLSIFIFLLELFMPAIKFIYQGHLVKHIVGCLRIQYKPIQRICCLSQLPSGRQTMKSLQSIARNHDQSVVCCRLIVPSRVVLPRPSPSRIGCCYFSADHLTCHKLQLPLRGRHQQLP